MIDKLIIEFDKGLRTLLASPQSVREHPDAQHTETTTLSDDEKRHAAALMRVNHCGEVCAQALYQGQAMTAKNPETSAAMQQAAQEETEHLAWCESRIKALGGHTSVLNPLFYASSFMIGATAGAMGDKWNLGFLAETERQVSSHLADHLTKLPEGDIKSRAVVSQMQIDEAQHAATAVEQGAAELPKPIKYLMKKSSKTMTTTSYYL